MKKPELYSAISPFRVDVGLDCSCEPSMCRQEFKDDCDVNLLMSRYYPGMFDRPIDPSRFVDLTIMPADLMEAMDQVHQAEAGFMSLPAQVRREFDHDPMRFMEFAVDPENLPKMREWGLTAPAPAPTLSEAVQAGFQKAHENMRQAELAAQQPPKAAGGDKPAKAG